MAVERDWRGMLLGPLRYDRTKIGGGEGSGDDPARRRLFVEGEEEGDAQQLQIYKALPVDIRLEILEELLISSATVVRWSYGFYGECVVSAVSRLRALVFVVGNL